jgi:FAD/FMN-containing dehydrogenase
LTTEADEFICSDRSYSGCFLPIDPPFSEKATMGGIVAANSSGPRRLLYNLPRDHILGVRIVTPTGNIAGAGGKTVKNVSGYDISKLMIGSIGSLGFICEMTFKLLPLPEQMETLLFSFDSFSDAANLADRIFETALLPAAVEVMNSKAYTQMKKGKPLDFHTGRYVVAVALEAFEEAVKRMKKEIKKMAENSKAKGAKGLRDQEHLQFWLAFSNLDPALLGRFSGLIRARLNYPISAWMEIFRFAENALSQMNLEHTISAHAGSGICTINILMDQDDAGLLEKATQILGRLLEHTREAEGNMVIQHAPASAKERLLIWGESGSDFGIMKRVKEQVDPYGIMSPGRFVGGL